jgi:hypothetical protein
LVSALFMGGRIPPPSEMNMLAGSGPIKSWRPKPVLSSPFPNS